MSEVIIDGCNVADCGFYNDDIKSRSYPEFDCYIERSGGEYDYSCARCCDRPNCQYKQLQRAKAENEKLKADKKQLLKDCNSCNFHKYKKALEDIKIISDNYNLTVNKRRKQIADKINEVLND